MVFDRILTGALALALFVTASSCGKSKYKEAGEDLLNAYQSACSSYGSMTEAALAHTASLKSLLEKLKKDNRCAAVAGALGSIQTLEDNLKRIEKDPSSSRLALSQETQRAVLERYNREASAATPNADLMTALAGALATAEVDLAYAQAEAKISTEVTGASADTVRGLGQLSQYASILLSNQTGLNACAENNPAVAAQVGAGVLALAGSLVSPALGAVMTLSGTLMSDIVGFAGNWDINQAISKVETTQLAVGLSCALESMTSLYCTANDLNRIVELQAASYDHDDQGEFTVSEFWTGIDLLSNELPSLIRWVRHVAAGNDPTDDFDANRKNSARSDVNRLEVTWNYVKGSFNNTHLQLQSPPPGTSRGEGVGLPQWQDRIIRRMLSQVTGTMYGGTDMHGASTSPIRSYISSYTTLLYRIAGRDLALDDCNPNSMNGEGCKGADTIPLPAGANGTDIVALIASNANTVFSEIQQLLLANLRLVVEEDPLLILDAALKPYRHGEEAPIATLASLLAFLEKSAAHFKSVAPSQQDPELLQTLWMIENTKATLQAAIDKTLTPVRDETQAAAITQQLYQLFKLTNGVDRFAGRLQQHIRNDLNSRLAHGQAPTNVSEILYASPRNSVEELTRVPSEKLGDFQDDLEQSQEITLENLDNAVSIFGKSFNQSIKRLKKREEKWATPGATNPKNLRSKLCILLLASSPEWPKSVDLNSCLDAVVKSPFKKVPSLAFSNLYHSLKGHGGTTRKTPAEERVCLFHNFRREEYLYTVRGKRNRQFSADQARF